MLSIVVPVLNEEESLYAFYDELLKVLPTLDKEYEVLFIDDGSTDKSLEILKSFADKNKHIRPFSFRRNLGKSEALTFGFSKAKGDYIVTLDADLQDKPTEIHKLLEMHKAEGLELISGWRKSRRDKSKMKIISKMFNAFVGRLFDLHLHDYNCGLKFYTRDAAKSLRLYGGLHRFIPLIAYEQGFTVGEVAVEHAPRKFGTSKYGFSKVWKDLPDMFTMLFLVKYSKRPLHFFGIIGIIFSFIGVIFLSYLTFVHYVFGEIVGRRPILFIGILFILSGFQIFFTGFLADLMINISHAPKLLDEENLHYPLKYTSDRERK
jgi:glycosyltransferase involved in cell wall biosynthesis